MAPRTWKGGGGSAGGAGENAGGEEPPVAAGGGFYAGKGRSPKGGSGKGGGAGNAAGPPLPGALTRKLEALGYPEIQLASLGAQAYCKIVLWLEEEKIRYYEKHDRRVLRDFNKAWYGHVQDYCKELNVPADGLDERNMAVKLSVLNNLTNLAIHDIYRDKVEAGELALAGLVKVAGGAAGQENKQKLAELVPSVNKLLDCFALPQLPPDTVDADTIAALRCVHARVCPSQAEPTGAPIDIDKLPVGLEIDDPEVRRAAAVLRLLHGIELQQLQVNINQVINELQQLTADPKTDARLGRVGR